MSHDFPSPSEAIEANHSEYPTPYPVPRLGIPSFVYDYQLCKDTRELEACLQTINESGWEIVSVTEPMLCTFHIFFRRPAYG